MADLRRQLQLDAQHFLLLCDELRPFVVVQADFPDGDDGIGLLLGEGVELVQFVAPVVGRHRPGVQAQHLEDDSGMAVADLPHGRALVRVHIGLDHLPNAGLQRALHGRFRIRQQPFVVKVCVGINQHSLTIIISRKFRPSP